ncbi:uncharacterized protein N7483_011870 [Penicillium malachiteum]|uniref:uncharacterized protein n=1 Tax=Penicillium malachiteum TaxID=1324776 RepID=UPI0025497655|nr:uncharacterized protein N7483_011870 [Penicillium malachiteum]KAJ5714689.1 hypothetical protein N7483_011870 [Penicillium malachiteum]
MPASSVKRSLGVELTQTIKASRVLLVGAGGIGCELLKNLVLTGFGEIHVLDLDTIDLSNLNRQFLFRHEHIKKSKALVAKEVAQKFQPKAKLEAYHANIMEKQFNVDWFQSFTLVFNALDNLAARRHVNRMCLAAGVPLIESGTMGFNGQVQVIEKRPRLPIPFAPSTVGQPSQFIVSYGLRVIYYLYSPEEKKEKTTTMIWIAQKRQTMVEKEMSDVERETMEIKEIRDSMGSEEYTNKVFVKVFKTDIEHLLSTETCKEKKPQVLDWDKLSEESASLDPKIVEKIDQKEWTLPEAFLMFNDSLNRLSERLQELQKNKPENGPKPILEFDKDDEDTLVFVTATGILRSAVFDIEPKSKFDTKQMAGNIIPAIATTNAMTAGLCVLQAFKVLQGELTNAKMVFLERSGARAINSDSLNPPRSDCGVCSTEIGHIFVDPKTATLNDIVEGVLRTQLGYGEELSILKDSGVIYDLDFDDHLSKKLSELGINNDSSITIVDEDDQDQDPRVNLELHIIERTNADSEESTPVSLKKSLEIRRQPKPAQPSSKDASGIPNPGKRKREGDDDLANGHVAKKVAGEPTSNGNDDGVIVLDDEGAILIED